jgi:3-oxoacyl-[acyl-carrier-protein] synthase II
MDVFVTGLGVLSPLGNNPTSFAEALREGKSGLKPFTRFDVSRSRCRVAGQVEGYGDDDRLVSLGRDACFQALSEAGWRQEADPTRCGVFLASSKGGMEVFGDEAVPANFQLQDYWAHQPGSVVRKELGWTGGGGNYALACATGAYAIGAAYEAIASGRLDAALAGSVEASLTPLVWRSFEGLGVLNPCGGAAREVRGAFDAKRKGFALGEGAGVLLLESAGMARKRGVWPWARFAGWSCTSDAMNLVSPDPEGKQAARSMREAWKKSGLAGSAPAYLNAHGTATVAGDLAESRAIALAFGEVGLPVSGIKAATGHLLGAAGSVEAVATVQALWEQVIPPTIQVEAPMEGLSFDLVRDKARPAALQHALSLSMGFGGHNVALVFERV